MGTTAPSDFPDCTKHCRSVQHGDIITAAISKRQISDLDLCAFLTYTCMRCESVRDSSGRTALHVAASCGRLDLVKWLVHNRHADINVKDRESGYSALHRSIFYGKIHVAVELIKLGADTNELDFDYLTSIEHAMKDGLKPDSKCGELYSWGFNNNNLLGPQQARETPDMLDVFHKEYPNESVQQICIDQFHSVIVTNSGKAYSCGHGQGGRLGLGEEKTVVTPHVISFVDQKGESVSCVEASISRDHSVFLCSDGNVYTCGLNTYQVLGHQTPPEKLLLPRQLRHLSNGIMGVCAARYHSVAWNSTSLYTWGLNAGQLGHKANTKNENHYIIIPRAVKMINFDEVNIKAVAVSDGATAVCTGRGDIYVLHEYLCRKIASRQLNVIQISIVGGKLEAPSLSREPSKKLNWELKVVALTNTGNILLWQESDPQLCRCIYSINRAILAKQVTINVNEILLVTDYGEAFKGRICPRKKKSNTLEKMSKVSEKSAFHKFLEKEDCVLLQLKKINRIHRGICIQSDSKGRDYCVIQAFPYNFFEFPEIINSEMRHHFQTLLEEADESDDIHDIVFKAGNKYFPAHSFIVSTKSSYFNRLFQNSNKEMIVLSDVHPDIFEQFLLFIYTGSCELTKCGELKNENLRCLCQKQNESEDKKESVEDISMFSDLTAYEYYSKIKPNGEEKQKNQNIRNPVRMLHEMAKRFECNELQKVLSNMEMHKCMIKLKNMQIITDVAKPLGYNRQMFPDLYDVTIRCRDNKELKAHKCILAARLEYFNNMFSLRWKGGETSDITLPFPRSIAEALLEFLYTDTLSYLNSKDTDHLFKVLILADQLFVTRLKEQCELLLTNLLTLKNAIQLLSFAHAYNAEKLKHCCMKFIVLNITPFLELRALDDLEEEILKELTEFYFQEKSEIWCRVITPYSTAVSDAEVIAISSTYPISLDDEVERVIVTKTTQKRKSRTHKTSASEKNNSVSVDTETNLDSVIQFPDILEDIVDKNSSYMSNRLRSITLASKKICSEEMELQFTKLSSNNNNNILDLSSSLNEDKDFPELNSPPSHHNAFHSRTTPPKGELRHKTLKVSQKQRKRLSSENNVGQSVAPPESPKNPWKIIPDVSSSVSPIDKCTIGAIISDERKQKGNLVKITSKLLTFTQIEDRAIDELHKFYNSENVTDEIIVIERVAIGAIASPVWVSRTK